MRGFRHHGYAWERKEINRHRFLKLTLNIIDITSYKVSQGCKGNLIVFLEVKSTEVNTHAAKVTTCVSEAGEKEKKILGFN